MLKSFGIDLVGLTRELESFLFLRAWLVARFGVSDDVAAQSAIGLYLGTFDPALVQIHVRKQAEGERGAPPSFLIPLAGNQAFVDLGFYRWRYKAVGETGKYTQTAPRILQVWGDGGTLNVVPAAVLYCTTTEIGGKTDSASFCIVRYDATGQPRLYRVYQLECPPDSNAWMLGNDPLSPAVLSGVARLDPPSGDVEKLIACHGEIVAGTHPHSFVRGSSSVSTGLNLLDWLAGAPDFPMPELLAERLDSMLCGR